jgi:hypothetical protein
MVAWTSKAMIAAALGAGVGDDFTADPYSDQVVAAANAVCFRKRAAAGYYDTTGDSDPAPAADVALGTTLYGVALWRERASTDGYSSFEDLAAFTPTGGSWGQIKRLLGIGKAAVDGRVVVQPL